MPLAGKTSLIVGADGFVGTNLRRWLDERGWAWHGVGKAAGDLSQPGVADAAFAAAPPCDVIFHLVTRQRTGQVQFGIQGELLAINSRIHLNILEAWRKHQPQALLLSAGSSCTYPESPEPLPESLFGAGGTHPSVFGYAQAKMLLATGSQAYASQYGLKWLHCVQATLFGREDHPEADRSHFMGALINRAIAEKAAGGAALSVWGSPDVVREVLYVDDQIEALVAAQAHFENRVLNCGANTPVTIGEAAQAILEGLEWDVPLTFPPNTFASASFKVLNSSEFLNATGWRPKISMVEGVRRMAAIVKRAN